MAKYLRTRDLTEQFNLSRELLYYWVKQGILSPPLKNDKNQYLWEARHIEEIKERHQASSPPALQTVEKFDLNNRRYLGNKNKLLSFIRKIAREHCSDATSFFDVFAGTGVVAGAFSHMDLIVNDLLYSNHICHVAFFSKGKYSSKKVQDHLKRYNQLGDISKDNYMSLHFGDKYYSNKVARKIGFIREDIAVLKQEDQLTDKEEAMLIASLLYAMDKIAHTCGHYDAFRKSKRFDDQLILKYPNVIQGKGKRKLYNQDANRLVSKVKADIAYIDPPYNSRQYSDAYHLLENIAKWDKPLVEGKAAKMDRRHLKSDYCTVKAPEAFSQLISQLSTKYILVSYNNMGEKGNDRSNAKITDQEIRGILAGKGKVRVFEKTYKAFNAGKSEIDDHKELLYLCENYDYMDKEVSNEVVASPLNYTGGKHRLLKQIRPLFPKKIDHFVDLFAGGLNVGLNVSANKTTFVDIEPHIIELYEILKNYPYDKIVEELLEIATTYGLSRTDLYGYEAYGVSSSQGVGTVNRDKFLKLRQDYNHSAETGLKKTLMFFTLLIYGFNNQIRFNKEGDYNLPVGKRDFNPSMKRKLEAFMDRLHKIPCSFICQDFRDFETKNLGPNDFVYADPPYLITTATYNEQNGWNENLEKELLTYLDRLHFQGVPFALSNVIQSKGKKNDLLEAWLVKNKSVYQVHYLNYHYSNSNYQTKNRNRMATVEVLITNY